jgi:hypothetical protein
MAPNSKHPLEPMTLGNMRELGVPHCHLSGLAGGFPRLGPLFLLMLA